MSELSRLQSQMSGADKLLVGRPFPATVGQEREWGAMRPEFFRGHKRGPLGTTDLMSEFTKLARGVSTDGPDTRISHDTPENQPIHTKRKLAASPTLMAQSQNNQYHFVFARTAMDLHLPPTDHSKTKFPGYHRNILMDNNSMSGSIGRDSSSGRSKYLYWHASIAEMNFILQGGEKFLGDDVPDQTIEDVLNEWFPDGAIIQRKANHDKFGKWYSTGDDAVVTVVREGMAYCVNYWGENATKGSSLFFIYKRVSRSSLPLKPNAYVMGLADSMDQFGIPETKLDGVNGADSLGLVTKPFQIIAYAAVGASSPPLSELRYIDNHGIRRVATYHKVGTVRDGSSKRTRHSRALSAMVNDMSAQSGNRIWIDIGV